jgi:hypothetical protein
MVTMTARSFRRQSGSHLCKIYPRWDEQRSKLLTRYCSITLVRTMLLVHDDLSCDSQRHIGLEGLRFLFVSVVINYR